MLKVKFDNEKNISYSKQVQKVIQNHLHMEYKDDEADKIWSKIQIFMKS